MPTTEINVFTLLGALEEVLVLLGVLVDVKQFKPLKNL
jgi:hypothetical protein